MGMILRALSLKKVMRWLAHELDHGVFKRALFNLGCVFGRILGHILAASAAFFALAFAVGFFAIFAVSLFSVLARTSGGWSDAHGQGQC